MQTRTFERLRRFLRQQLNEGAVVRIELRGLVEAESKDADRAVVDNERQRGPGATGGTCMRDDARVPRLEHVMLADPHRLARRYGFLKRIAFPKGLVGWGQRLFGVTLRGNHLECAILARERDGCCRRFNCLPSFRHDNARNSHGVHVIEQYSSESLQSLRSRDCTLGDLRLNSHARVQLLLLDRHHLQFLHLLFQLQSLRLQIG
jgi:hypothetical protein